MSKIKLIIKFLLEKINIGVTKYSTLQTLLDGASFERKILDSMDFLMAHPKEHTPQLIKLLNKSKSQLRQDLFVLSELNFKSNGFFVEFGATNGVDLSNTHLMESTFGWTGILAEPAKCWHKNLRKNRSSKIEEKCVWKDSNSTLVFNETKVAELSTISLFDNADEHSKSRKKGNTYNVRTISLNDLLEKYNAPAQIDFLSIDTEGSEFDILSGLDFNKYSFKVISCEHNFTPMREKIFNLLSSHGYERKFENLSQWDDWYVRKN